MTAPERDELRQLVDGLPDEQVKTAVEVMRQLSDVDDTPRPRRHRPSWVGALRESPDLSVRLKDILRNEMGQGRRR